MSEIPEHLDAQQAMLVERLRRAAGDAVTLEELRGMGIENPALLCYELAAVGIPIARTASPAGGMPALSVRLEHELEEPARHDRSRPREARAAKARRRRPLRRPRIGSLQPGGAAALAALAAVFALAVAIAFGELAKRHEPSASRPRAAAPQLPSASRRRPPAQPAPPTTTRRRPQPAPPASDRVVPGQPSLSPYVAVSLESEGHRLLAEGSYASAVQKLVSAVRSSGQSLARCLEPASDACLTFAYALYDLGRALRLEGRRAEAVAVLNERLSIDNQRATVQHELDLARGARA
ncbi:MAG TPA: hypothetical protein VGH78_05075 [Solirubrobacteraceae bacterium]